ncbi:hypothetical protein FRX31_005905 [Thalictrum thalictroides]|uniref:Uncharacterized protein n=1 Tax=Thalictrum thalictroides TaxID=46969 RepID=A0A7J6X3Z6_THATH|nr:hypothetical protein FRX31_005905 [Thalictrum thalictroides]
MENYVDEATYNADVEFWRARITSAVQRMKRMNWIQFASWSEYGHGDGVEEECSTWGYYGSQCVKNCPDCKAASIFNPSDYEVANF